ncbi:MAG: bifunctional phosphoribosylaminoimidazolecarboxamide formyltransferase/IMP cyclohydrolase [Nitrososphaerales archaeon]|nr:bifunctional phosphoribosylaminoimidazolecarboxamide formyltransferase/IMP cyclohydrolase [Nitrososphaerales archaeon]
MQDGIRPHAALVSVWDKSGLIPFAQTLHKNGVRILATSGTYKTLQEANVPCEKLEERLRYPEMLDGRVKTLQVEVFSAILAKREEDHLQQLKAYNIKPIDMVVCNFYPFERIASSSNVNIETLIENIDIGGPSLVRAAAKNYRYVIVVPDPKYYNQVAEELEKYGFISLSTRQRLAYSAFSIVAAYDIAIYRELKKYLNPNELFPEKFFISATKFEDAKYGENPHQRAAIYKLDGYTSMAEWEQLFGEQRSFNNYLDIGKAYEILKGFEHTPTAATVKHGNISGFAFAPTLAEAYTLAHECDPEADYGCATVVNRKVDVASAKLIGKNPGVEDKSVYTEILIAPDYDPEALEILKAKQKKKIRIIKYHEPSNYPYDVRVLEGVLLVQEPADYNKKLDRSKLTYPTKVKPDSETLEKLLAAWELVRKVPSNGIVIADGKVENGKLTYFWTYGVASFRKRNGAVKIALDNAGKRAKGAVAASDGFFPFRDSIDLLGEAGIKAVIQPGGSINDEKIIEAANEYNIAMVFTHERAFKH